MGDLIYENVEIIDAGAEGMAVGRINEKTLYPNGNE